MKNLASLPENIEMYLLPNDKRRVGIKRSEIFQRVLNQLFILRIQNWNSKMLCDIFTARHDVLHTDSITDTLQMVVRSECRPRADIST